jgi:branched-chain amino acid transport system permease protein
VGAIAVTLVVLLLLFLFFRYTTLGLAMRAAAQNPTSSRLCGIRVGWMLALGWGLAAVFGAVAGMMVAPVVFLDPNMMGGIQIYAFAAATVGGFTSPMGAVVGGLLVGVVENLVGTYVSFIGTELKLTVALAMIIIVLLVKPSGLFGRSFVRRVLVRGARTRSGGDRGPAPRARRGLRAPLLPERVPRLPVHPGLHLRHRAARPQYSDGLQRPDLPRPRRLLRDRRLCLGDHDRPVHIGYGWTIPTAGILCLVVGFLFGWPALRLEGLYLALATLSLALALPQILKYFEHWTGGSQGIVLSKPKPPWGLPLSEDQWLYFVTLAILIALFVLASNLLRGRTGPRHRGHPGQPPRRGNHGDQQRALQVGGVRRERAYTGIAGALSAFAIAFVAPDSFDVFLSVTLLTGIVIGGLATISGAIFGAIFILFVPNWALDISKAAALGHLRRLLIVFMYVMPRGIAGSLRLLWIRWTRPAVVNKQVNADVP